MAAGLPVKIVVLTIVGMAGLGAMLTFISDSSSLIPEPMHARINGSGLLILSTSPETIEIPLEVINSNNGRPVVKANAVLSGLELVAINMTGNNGETIIKINKNDLELKSNEGYLGLEVRATGFRDYVNEFAIKVVK